MKNVILFLDRISSLKSFIILLLIYIVFPAYFFKNAETKINQLSGESVGIIDITITYNPERTQQMLTKYTAEARAYYASVEATIDVVYPLVYAFLLAVVLVLIFRKNQFGLPRWIIVLPFVVQLFDYLENFFIYSLLTQYPTIENANLIFCEIFKLLKWSVLGITMLIIVYGVIRNLQKNKIRS
jgi:hypothetical protein